MRLLRSIVPFLLVACGGSSPPPTESSPPPTESSPPTEETAAIYGTCDIATTCDACLSIAGCNWTGGQCSTQCLMDTWCMGPGNSAAPVCTTPPATTGPGW